MGKNVDTAAFSDFIRSLYDRFQIDVGNKIRENGSLCIADFMKDPFSFGASPEMRSGRKKEEEEACFIIFWV